MPRKAWSIVHLCASAIQQGSLNSTLGQLTTLRFNVYILPTHHKALVKWQHAEMMDLKGMSAISVAKVVAAGSEAWDLASNRGAPVHGPAVSAT